MKLACLLMLFLCFTTPFEAKAEEFANIFGTEEVRKGSSEASAKALSAIGSAIEALRLRELGEEGSQERLLEASSELFAASKGMQDLLGEGFPDFEFSDQDYELINARISGGINARHGDLFEGAKSFGDFFGEFIALGDKLANALETAAAPAEGSSALSYFAQTLADYLVVGDLITGLSRSRFN